MALTLPQTTAIALDRRGPVLHLTLNRPETRNAMSSEMVNEIVATFAAIEASRSIRVVVLRGAGGHFCAGGDIKTFAAAMALPEPGAPDTVIRSNAAFGRMLARIDHAPQVTIAAIEGSAMGGGFGIACVTDIAIATADASFAMPEATLGLPPAQIAPFVVARIGLTAARRLAVTAGRIDGAGARDLGLVHLLAAETTELATLVEREIAAALRCAPEAVAATKTLMHRAARPDQKDLIEEAANAFARALRGTEGREGTTAFVQKRKPAWAETDK